MVQTSLLIYAKNLVLFNSNAPQNLDFQTETVFHSRPAIISLGWTGPEYFRLFHCFIEKNPWAYKRSGLGFACVGRDWEK